MEQRMIKSSQSNENRRVSLNNSEITGISPMKGRFFFDQGT